MLGDDDLDQVRHLSVVPIYLVCSGSKLVIFSFFRRDQCSADALGLTYADRDDTCVAQVGERVILLGSGSKG
jgi:hypothetical protein